MSKFQRLTRRSTWVLGAATRCDYYCPAQLVSCLRNCTWCKLFDLRPTSRSRRHPRPSETTHGVSVCPSTNKSFETVYAIFTENISGISVICVHPPLDSSRYLGHSMCTITRIFSDVRQRSSHSLAHPHLFLGTTPWIARYRQSVTITLTSL